MAKPIIVDITQDNTPIKQNERPGDAPKTCGCGGKCGSKKHLTSGGDEKGKKAQLFLLAVILFGSIICYFYFS